jgi:hypothetical protein
MKIRYDYERSSIECFFNWFCMCSEKLQKSRMLLKMFLEIITVILVYKKVEDKCLTCQTSNPIHYCLIIGGMQQQDAISLANGRFIGQQTIRGELDKALDNVTDRLVSLAKDFRTGVIDGRTWQIESMSLIKQTHLIGAALEKGGWNQLTQS